MSVEIDCLSLCLQTPNCLPVLFWGDTGIGKTSQVNQLLQSLGWDGEILRPGERGEGALGVVPVPSEDRTVLHYPLPDWAARLRDSKRPSLLFLDEISSTPPGLQPAIMGLALDGVIAGQRLPERVKRCAVANPVDQAAGGWEIALPLANRFIHLTWKRPEVGAWTNWLAGQGDAASSLQLDLDIWEKEWGMARALGAGFLRRFPGALAEEVDKVIGRTPPAFSTPRTWESALRLLASCRATNRMDLYPVLASGCLGGAVALEGASGDPAGAWLVWLNNNDLPDPEDVLKDPTLFQHDPRRPDRTFAILFSVAEAGMARTNGKKLTEKQRVERWNNAGDVLARALDMKLGKDLVLLPARLAASTDRRPMGRVDQGWQRVGSVLGDFLDMFKNVP